MGWCCRRRADRFAGRAVLLERRVGDDRRGGMRRWGGEDVRRNCGMEQARAMCLAVGGVGPAGGVPDFHGVVAAAGGEEFGVRAEGEAHDEAFVAAEFSAEGPGGGVPDADGGVFAGGGEEAAVGAEGDRE